MIDQSAHPGHHITVTPMGVFGRVVLECTCGIERRFASTPPANAAGLRHHNDLIGAMA